MDEAEDKELVAQAKAGNLESFGRLVERYHGQLYKTIRRFIPNHEDTNDLMQETWMHAWRNLANFREEANFYPWIYRIALNLTINFLRKQRKEGQKESFEDWKKREGDNSSQILLGRNEALELFEFKPKLEEALKTLPLPYRTAFVLVTQEGLNYRQVAEILGCSENTVAWRMYKARQWLQKKLKPYFEGRQ
ncbi:MAG: sigma-70 family RNA polymerase sigma factor [Candidatus Aminicenantes bacterium]|nr:sigma-70 family RNA polymerase sigma factor [Candidatus Aminicenantes bacterium]